MFKYTLTRKGDTTYFSIQEQPEEWRGKGLIYTASNGWKIYSKGGIKIYNDYSIYLRGDKRSYDNYTDMYECLEYEHSAIASALSEFAAWANKSEVKEVKRHAENGEYIKLLTNGRYAHMKPGMILKISGQSPAGNAKAYDDVCSFALNYLDDEYVVLEGYEPEQKQNEPKQNGIREVKRQAKIGEYIKVININKYTHDNRFDIGDVLKVNVDDSNVINQWIGRAVGFENVTHPERTKPSYVILNEDYVVLEGYTPEPPKPAQHRFEYAISRWYGATLFKVLRMPEEWKPVRNDFNRLVYESKNGIVIVSDIFTNINKACICLCDGKADDSFDSFFCSRSEHRRIVAALKELQEWADKEEQK